MNSSAFESVILADGTSLLYLYSFFIRIFVALYVSCAVVLLLTLIASAINHWRHAHGRDDLR